MPSTTVDPHIADVLAGWRDAERLLETLADGSPERARCLALIRAFRSEYGGLFERNKHEQREQGEFARERLNLPAGNSPG